MKKATAFLMTLVLLLSLAACGGQTPAGSDPAQESSPVLSAEDPSAETASTEEETAPVKPGKTPEDPSKATQLFSFSAAKGTNQAQTIRSNSTQSWMRTACVGTDTEPSLSVMSFYNNYDKGSGGLPGEERIWFELVNMSSFSTKLFYSLQLTLRNLYVAVDSDINMNTLDQMQLLYSTDNGASFTPVPIRVHYTQGEYLVLSDKKTAILYTLWTDDLLEVLPADALITDIRVKPFGDYGSHYGGLRLVDVDLTAYSGELPVRKGDEVRSVETVHIPEETLREIVVTQMMQVATATCKLTQQAESYNYTGPTGVGDKYSLIYPAGITLRGPIYSRTRCISAGEWFESIDAGGVYTAGYTDDTVAGMDCARITHDAIHTVSTARATYTAAYTDPELTYLGKLNNDENLSNAPEIVARFSDQDQLEAMALLREGDLVVSFAGNNAAFAKTVATHVRLVTGAPVVYRDEKGRIIPEQSYLYCTEAGGTVYHYYQKNSGEIVRTTDLSLYRGDSRFTYLYSGSVRVNEYYSFASLLEKYYIPMSLKVYETEEVQKFSALVTHHMTAENFVKGVRLAVSANYRLPYLDVTITNDKGQTVYSKRVSVGSYTFLLSFADEETDAWIKAAPAGSYHYSMTTQSGPVLEVGGEVPRQTLFAMDFTK